MELGDANDCNDIVEASSFGGQLPLSPGMAVLSHYSGLYKKINGPDNGASVVVGSSKPNRWVLSVVDIRDPANASSTSPSVAPIGDNWTEVGLGRFVHSSWLQSNLGELFGDDYPARACVSS